MTVVQPAVAGNLDEDFDSFFARTCHGLLARALMFCGHRQDAEDAVQNAYVAALRSWDRIRVEYESPEAWLHTVARNELCAQARRRARERKAIEVIPVPRDPTPEQSAEAMEVLAALAGLPPRQRAAIVLHRLYGLPQEEIAQMLGTRRSTVAVSLRDARRRLENVLQSHPAARPADPREALVAGSGPLGRTAPRLDLLAVLLAAERWLRDGIEDSAGTPQRLRAAVAARAGLHHPGRQEGLR